MSRNKQRQPVRQVILGQANWILPTHHRNDENNNSEISKHQKENSQAKYNEIVKSIFENQRVNYKVCMLTASHEP